MWKGKEKRRRGRGTLVPQGQAKTQIFQRIRGMGRISSSLGFIILLWGCKGVGVWMLL